MVLTSVCADDYTPRMADKATPTDERLHRFALAVTRGDLAAYPVLDGDLAVSPLAESARRAGVGEVLLARELARGIQDTKPGADHVRYLRLAAKWLGYKCEQEVETTQRFAKGTAAGGSLAAAVAGALIAAKSRGILTDAHDFPEA